MSRFRTLCSEPTPFLAIGLAFVGLGLSGQDTFLYLGLGCLIRAAWPARRGSGR